MTCLKVKTILGCAPIDEQTKEQLERSKELDKKIKQDGEDSSREVKVSILTWYNYKFKSIVKEVQFSTQILNWNIAA